MAGVSLFEWYVVTISWSIAFLIVASIFLYAKRRTPAGTTRTPTTVSHMASDFVFVWVLISLLVFYVVTVIVKSTLLFAAGNIIVELLLLLYVFRNRAKTGGGS